MCWAYSRIQIPVIQFLWECIKKINYYANTWNAEVLTLPSVCVRFGICIPHDELATLIPFESSIVPRSSQVAEELFYSSKIPQIKH